MWAHAALAKGQAVGSVISAMKALFAQLASQLSVMRSEGKQLPLRSQEGHSKNQVDHQKRVFQLSDAIVRI